MKIKSLYENPQLYEAECRYIMTDKKFWKEVVKRENPVSVLEIGCGTGRVAEFIIDDQLQFYCGIDISEIFLNYFKEKEVFKKNEYKISLINADVESIILEQKFDLIIFTSQFIGHIYEIKSFVQIFSNVKKMLKSSGKIIIDYCNPDLRFLEVHKEYQYCYEFWHDEKIKVFEKNYYSQNEQINYEQRKYEMETGKNIFQTIPFRIYFPKELDALFMMNGLKILAKYGNYNMEKFEEYREKQIYFLTK
jgi:SAM-dependent methyltransferase